MKIFDESGQVHDQDYAQVGINWNTNPYEFHK